MSKTKLIKDTNGKIYQVERKKYLLDRAIAIVSKAEEILQAKASTPENTEIKLKCLVDMKRLTKIIVAGKLTTKEYTGLLNHCHQLLKDVRGA